MDVRGRRQNPPMQMMVDSTKGTNPVPTILFFTFKILGLVIPMLPIYLGYKLFLLGVTGEASIVVDATTIKGQLLNAAPGLFFAVGGIVALIVAIVKGVKYQG